MKALNVSIEIKDVAGLLATIDNVPYEFIEDLIAHRPNSDAVIVWRFGNKDVILNMRNIVNIIVKKE